MMHEFLTANRMELIDLCQKKVVCRAPARSVGNELDNGIPLFIDQLIKTLKIEQGEHPMRSREVSGPSSGCGQVFSEIGQTAALHGRELLRSGFTVEQVVHDYGDLCQAVTELAFKKKEEIKIEEFQTLNRCLDNAIAVAVSEFTYTRESAASAEQSNASMNTLSGFAHELHDLVSVAIQAMTVIKGGRVGVTGATGSVLDHSLVGIRDLTNRALLSATSVPVSHETFSLANFIADVSVAANLEAVVKDRALVVSSVDPELAVQADRDLLFSSVGSLLGNAFKVASPKSKVTLNAHSSANRILIDVGTQNQASVLAATEKMLPQSAQRGDAQTGPELSACRSGVEANGGSLTVRDTPGVEYVTTISLPRHKTRSPPVEHSPEIH